MEALAIGIAAATAVFVVATARGWLRGRPVEGGTIEVDDVESIERVDDTHANVVVRGDPSVMQREYSRHARGAPPKRGLSRHEQIIGRIVVSVLLAAGGFYVLALADDPSSAAENWASGALGALFAYWVRD